MSFLEDCNVMVLQKTVDGVCTNWETAVTARGKHRKTALQQLLALLVSRNLRLKYSRHHLNATAGCTSCCAISNHLILILK